MSASPSENARLLSLCAQIITQHAQVISTMARFQEEVARLALPIPTPVLAPPDSLRAMTRTADTQAGDPGAGAPSGAHEAGSSEESAAEPQGRDEPVSGAVASGAPAGAGDEQSEPSPAARDITKKRAAKRKAPAAREPSTVATRQITQQERDLVAQRLKEIRTHIAERNATIAQRVFNGDDPKAIAEDLSVSVSVVKNVRNSTKPATEAAREPSPEPMEITTALPVPAEAFPAPIPVLAVPDDRPMIVADGVVHGPLGIEERFGAKEIAVLTRLQTGDLYDQKTLQELIGTDNEMVATYVLNGMRPKLAAIGVELFQPLKKNWRCRRMEEQRS